MTTGALISYFFFLFSGLGLGGFPCIFISISMYINSKHERKYPGIREEGGLGFGKASYFIVV